MKPTASQILTLSELPPSVNGLFANRIGGRYKTPKYKAWIKSAGAELMAQRPGKIVGPYAVTYTLQRKNKRFDLGNTEKGLSDLLVAHGVVEDDRFAQRILLEWGPVEGVHIMVCSTKERGE